MRSVSLPRANIAHLGTHVHEWKAAAYACLEVLPNVSTWQSIVLELLLISTHRDLQGLPRAAASLHVETKLNSGAF